MSRKNAADWIIYSGGYEFYYAWNGYTRKRIALYPIPEGGTWRDSLHSRTQGPCGVNAFSLAVEQFERLIGPYYPSRPGARHD